jgi:hypothetical protein
MKIELETLLERVVAWPDAAQDRLVHAIREIEAQQREAPARAAPAPSSFVADAETQAFIKRHSLSFF